MNNPQQLTTLLTLAFAVSAITLTITKTEAFRPVRYFFNLRYSKNSKNPSKKFWDISSYFVHCSFCFSFWASLIILALKGFTGWALIQSIFVVMGMACLIMAWTIPTFFGEN